MIEKREKVFVTGASGFLGHHLIGELLAAGYEVRALVRDPARYHGPLNHSLQLVRGDLHDDLTPNLQGISIVIHTAALVDPACADQNAFRDLNYRCTLDLARAAIRQEVPSFIFISTSNTIGFGDLDHPGNEDLPMRAPFTRNDYAVSKYLAEQGLAQLTGQLNVITIHPGFMIGKGAPYHGFGRMLRWALGKKLVLFPPGGKNFISVTDVARGILLAMKRGKPGEHYLIVNENLTYRQFFSMVARLGAMESRMLPVPASLMRLMGFIGNGLRMLGVTTPLSTNHTQILSVCNFYDNSKSRRCLGMEYECIERTISSILESLK